MTQNLYQILPKVLCVMSKKKENSRLRLGLFTPHPSPYPTFYHSLLFFSFLLSLGWFVSCQFYLFPKSFSPGTNCQKVLNVLFHTGTVKDTYQKKELLASFPSSIFLCPYDNYFQPYSFHDYFLCQSLISAHVPPSELRFWNFCLRGFWKTDYLPTFR